VNKGETSKKKKKKKKKKRQKIILSNRRRGSLGRIRVLLGMRAGKVVSDDTPF